MLGGNWRTNATPSPYKPKEAIGFHIVAKGSLWLEYQGNYSTLNERDILLLPFGAPHWIGVGTDGPVLDPAGDLPDSPWRQTPIMRYGDQENPVRILCGYIICNIKDFAPFAAQLPELIHVRLSSAGTEDWLVGIVDQIVQEVDHSSAGSLQMLTRLTDLALLEVIRRQMKNARNGPTGWSAAARSQTLNRCLHLIHEHPMRNWSLNDLARQSGQSKSALSGSFSSLLNQSPIQYLRRWRLFLAAQDLRAGRKGISEISFEYGYGTEAAFSRAFKKTFGLPPSKWRNRFAGE